MDTGANFRRELEAEFEALWQRGDAMAPKNVEAIIVLAGDGNKSPDDVSRIRFAAAMLHQLEEDFDHTDRMSLPRVILNGEIEELQNMYELAIEAGISTNLIHRQSCGRKGEANHITQFEVIRSDPATAGMRNFLLVTSTYHIPRVRRTATKYLPPEVSFVVMSNPHDMHLHNHAERQVGEIERIIVYAGHGDIARVPRC